MAIACATGAAAQSPDADRSAASDWAHWRVIPVQVVPNDHAFDSRRLALDVTALVDVERWYGRVLDGVSFRSAPFVVQRSRHSFEELAADDFQAWWPLLGAEFAEYGLAWQNDADFKLLLLVQGAGGWAGGDSENGGIESTDEAGRSDKGAWGGLVLIGDSAAAGIVAGACPVAGEHDGTVWWCNWDTYRGTIAHELGHTWGIPHPDALLPAGEDGTPRTWDCDELGNTVMQCHWNFPADSLLTYEAVHLRSLPFFAAGPEPVQMLAETLPVSVVGDVRLTRFDVSPEGADGVAWVDGRGGGTGYPWAVSVRNGSVTWRLAAGCGNLVTDLGRARGAGGKGTALVVAGGDTLLSVPLAGDSPSTHTVEYCTAGPLTLASRGQGRFRAVFGNARIYPSR